MVELISLVVMNALISLLKRIPAFATLPDGWHKTVVRVIVLVLAYVSSVATAWMAGMPVDLSPVAQALPTIIMFLASQGAFFLVSKKKA